ncbi:DUF6573 family protein [Megalodesulfovibrio gigas]|uniref:Uncharacterized protein n=1 Tax=Megalodesulfovibrio gigas (strain ATCC 19364 / DSM 1382 / NCIMB 9332 / VKM B-1759) TaxID=1121448 RepID=T2GCJ8_MEGG1|nr:DUF6573 family protein [Megalodesulfovibrio gigas]AGW13851.1 hypothetical protein DGI_2084 [Megalodesulfovibrio gigas DSM 1382 = ATCC 19364]
MSNDESWNVIYTYTRAQAIADGVLVDVTTQARQSGFKVPVAVTERLFHQYIIPPPGLEGEGQSIEGRLHDLFFQSIMTAQKARGKDRVAFEVLFLMRPGEHETVHCILHIGPGDAGEPVVTIMLPGDE